MPSIRAIWFVILATAALVTLAASSEAFMPGPQRDSVLECYWKPAPPPIPYPTRPDPRGLDAGEGPPFEAIAFETTAPMKQYKIKLTDRPDLNGEIDRKAFNEVSETPQPTLGVLAVPPTPAPLVQTFTSTPAPLETSTPAPFTSAPPVASEAASPAPAASTSPTQ